MHNLAEAKKRMHSMAESHGASHCSTAATTARARSGARLLYTTTTSKLVGVGGSPLLRLLRRVYGCVDGFFSAPTDSADVAEVLDSSAPSMESLIETTVR